MSSDLSLPAGAVPPSGGRRPGRPPKASHQGEEPHVEAVERALAILEAFDSAHPRLSLSDLAGRAGLYPSTVLRLATSLGRFGYLQRGDDGRFRLGAAPLRLGAIYRGAFSLTDYLRPALAELVGQTGETAVFYVREGDRRICLSRHHPRRAVHHHVDEGASLPLEVGAGGHVLMAFTGGTSALHGQVRRRGYAVSIGERDADAGAVAAPVFGAEGGLVGAMGVAGVATRLREMDLPALGRLVRSAARDLTADLGGPWPSFRDD